jgi:hypothetical protein
VGAVQPSTSAGPVTVKRTLISQGCYQDSSAISCATGLGDDTGTLITTNPQDGGGNVYNLDLPGVTFNRSGATPIVRVRYNFLAFAAGPSGTSISNFVSCFVRLSCYQDANGVAHFSYDANSDDNKIGLGTTSTSLNLN